MGDILFNIFCQSSLTPSRVFTTKLEKYYQTVENGIPVDYSDNKYLRASKISQEDHGVCITGVWIEHCKKIGINPWLSFRMNDHHCWQDDTSSLRSDFYYEAKRNGWLLGEKYRSSQNDFDYGVPEVREKMLAYIKEQLTTFDVFGIELDFMRVPKCVKFYDDPHACDHLNEFLARTKQITERCAALHGHPNLVITLQTIAHENMAAGGEMCVQFLHCTLLTNLLSNHEQFISNIIILGSY